MPTSRSIRRKRKLEERKKAQKKTKDKLGIISNTLGSMPESCNKCEVLFDKQELEFYLNWHIRVDHKGSITLSCPQCMEE